MFKSQQECFFIFMILIMVVLAVLVHFEHFVNNRGLLSENTTRGGTGSSRSRTNDLLLCVECKNFICVTYKKSLRLHDLVFF